MKFLTMVLLAVALGCILWGVFDLLLLSQGTAEPEAVTLEQLGRLDGTKNVHLTISEFKIGDGFFQEKGNNGEDQRFWLPLLTEDGKWTPRPVVAWVAGKVDQAQLNELDSRRVLTGIVSNVVQSVGPSQCAKLNETYPDQNFSNSLAFNIDRVFPTAQKVIGMFVVGFVSLILSIPLLIRQIRNETPPTPASDAELNNRPTDL